MGIPNSVIQPMQKVQNAAARLTLRAPRHQHCTPLLQQLHWLPISERIKTKLPACVTTQLLVPPPLTFLNYCSCTALPALSSDTRILKLRRFNRKTRCFRFFCYFGPHIWNNFPSRRQTLYYSPFLQKQIQHTSLR